MCEEKISILETKFLWEQIVYPISGQIILAAAALPPPEQKQFMAAKIHRIVSDYLAERKRRRAAGEPPLFEGQNYQ